MEVNSRYSAQNSMNRTEKMGNEMRGLHSDLPSQTSLGLLSQPSYDFCLIMEHSYGGSVG